MSDALRDVLDVLRVDGDGAPRVHGSRAILDGPLPVGELALACVGGALVCAAELAEARGAQRPEVAFDAAHVERSFTSERYARLDGEAPGAPFDPLSTWLETADGWLRTHGNYVHHRTALCVALGLHDPDVSAVRAVARARGAVDLEEAIVAVGGCAAALRTRAEWEAHPAGAALAGRGLLDLWPPGLAPKCQATSARHDLPGAMRLAVRPAAGMRVLDLTRVIAGPVGGRTLAALGADVLRIDPPGLAELPLQVLDGTAGKRTALLDLRAERDAFERLLAGADVLLTGYRPGALDALGLGHDALAERHPQLVVVSLSAWGDDGPWGNRRGFDSLVQAASGIADAVGPEGAGGGAAVGGAAATPGRLPAQALDHGTGHLAAAAALRGLVERERTGRPLHARLALARTAAWLLAGRTEWHFDRAMSDSGATRHPTVELDAGGRTATLVAPPGTLDGEPLRWTHARAELGVDRAEWPGATLGA